MAQTIIRQTSIGYGFECVDLPALFAKQVPVPGNDWFLDYCHLSAKGICSSMEAVAVSIHDRLAPDRGRPSVPDALPAAEVEATARFGAAIHGAHRMLPVTGTRACLAYWCEAALEASPGIAQAMLDLLEMRTAPCDAVLTEAQRRNLVSPYRVMLQHGLKYPYLDPALLLAVVDALEARGIGARARLNHLLLAHHAPTEAGRELLPYYLWEPLARFFPEVMSFSDLTEWAILRAPWPETDVCLVAGGGLDLELDLLVRLPKLEGEPSRNRPLRRPIEDETGMLTGDRTLGLAINGQTLERRLIHASWQCVSVRIPTGHLSPGINKLTLRWPMPQIDGDTALELAISRLEQGHDGAIHPVFGEIASIKARSV